MECKKLAALILTACMIEGGVFAQSGPYDAANIVVSSTHRFEFLFDFDENASRELLSWWYTDSDHEEAKLSLFRVEPDGSLTSVWITWRDIDEEITHSAITHGPIDNRTGDEIVMILNDELTVWTRDGSSLPVLMRVISLANNGVDVVVADFNQDGHGEFATIQRPNFGPMTLYLNDGTNNFSTSDQGFPGLAPRDLTVIDADGNTTPDLACITSTELAIYSIDNGLISNTRTFDHGISNPMLVAGDIDNDLDEDLVVFGVSGNYVVFRRDGVDSYTMEPAAIGGPATDFYDVDGDGDLDGACCGGGGGGGSPPPDHNTEDSLFRVAINDGTGSFAAAFEIQGLGAHHLAGVEDLDQDGDNELIAGRVIYYPSAPITAPLTYSIVNVERGTLFDVDMDGDDDIRPGSNSVQRNMGDGTFINQTPTTPNPPAGTVYVGPGFPIDIDGDFDLDLVVTHESDGGLFLGMRKLINTGGGGYLDGGNASALNFNLQGSGNDPSNCVSGDADGDGDSDLLVVSRLIPNTRVWWNDGNGNFAEGPEFPGQIAQWVGDVHQDGFPDIVFTWDPKLCWREGQGNGTFGNIRIFAYTEVNPAQDRIAAVDWDQDGFIDFIALDEGGGDLDLYRNNQSTSFQASQLSDGFTRDDNAAKRVVVDDFDHDGDLDIVAGPLEYSASDAFRVLLNDGAGGFVTFDQLISPEELSDIDGDGDLDALGDVLMTNRIFDDPQIDGSRRQYGEGYPGSENMVPTFGVKGPFRPGETGELILTGAHGQRWALLTVGLEESATPDFPKIGMTSYCFPWQFFLVQWVGGPDEPGAGTWSLPYPVPSVGASIYHQIYIFDEGALNRVSATNGLEIYYPL